MDDATAATIRGLNQEFYRSYPKDYFARALNLVLAAVVDPVGALSPLASQQTIRQSESDSPLKVRVPAELIDSDAMSAVARIQLGQLYYQALETLVRLFIAHRPSVACPWIEIASEVDFRVFKAKVATIKAYEPEWTGSHEEDAAFRYVFLPLRSIDEKAARHLAFAKQWMVLAATEVLENLTYNAFKHGMAINAGEAEVAYPAPMSGANKDENIKPLLHAKGDSVSVLRYERQGNQRVWHQETQWINHNERAAAIMAAQQYITAILNVGTARFDSGTVAELRLPPFGPGELLYSGRPTGFHVTRMSMSLGIAQERRQKK
jgi:hypothetical protein